MRMLKRKDLVDQFELVVKQEIVNSNRERSIFNSRITDIASDLDISRKDLEKKLKSLDHYLQTLNEKFMLLASHLEHSKKTIDSRLNDNSQLQGRVGKQISTIEENLERLNKRLDESEVKIDALDLYDSERQRKLDSLEKQSACELNRLECRIKNKLDEAVQSLSDKPSEINRVTSELYEIISKLKKDYDLQVQCLLKENKRIFIAEKNIENIYTLIERITQG